MLPHQNAEGVYVIDARTLTPTPRREPTNERPGGPGFIEIHDILENENVRIERKLFRDEDVDQLCLSTFDTSDNINIFAAPHIDTQLTLTVQINQSRYEITLDWRAQTLVLDTRGGNDRIHIEDNVIVPVFVYSGEGDDRMLSAARAASLYTGPGDDFIAVVNGACHVEAGEGDDEVHGFQDTHMTVYGGPGADQISGGSGSCFLDGGQGDDHIVGGRGLNILSGGPGNDRIKAGPASNVIYTGDGFNDVTRLKADDVTYYNFKSSLTVDCALMMHPDVRMTFLRANWLLTRFIWSPNPWTRADLLCKAVRNSSSGSMTIYVCCSALRPGNACSRNWSVPRATADSPSPFMSSTQSSTGNSSRRPAPVTGRLSTMTDLAAPRSAGRFGTTPQTSSPERPASLTCSTSCATPGTTSAARCCAVRASTALTATKRAIR